MKYEIGKRLLDLLGSLFGFFIFLPVVVIITIQIKLNSQSSVFFKQTRVGKNGKLFKIYKFRTMVENGEKIGPQVSKADDPRITKVGEFLRKYNMDEIPQFINVFKGEMSLVGPRPEVPKYVEAYLKDYKEILKVKPGMTDYATLEFIEENKFLKDIENHEEKYLKEILPVKIRYYKKYIKEMSLVNDFKIILKTIGRIINKISD